MFYVIKDDNIMMSTIKNYRLKVGCLMENPKMSVAIHNDGTNVRHQKAILVMGQATMTTNSCGISTGRSSTSTSSN
jgi:hypothetical protein